LTEAPRAQFVVKGHPAPKGSRTFLGGKGASKESSDNCKPWVEAIAMSCLGQRPKGVGLIKPPYRIGLRFAMPRPRNPKYDWPSADGDLDKLARAVLDGLVQGGMLLDDRHVIQLDCSKEFAAAGKSTGVSIVIL
jgi:Holliday junction resolvase RusA-like endonuclease